jgi:type IV pilus assembly protein PilC
MLESSGINIKRDYPLTDFLMKLSHFATDEKNIIVIIIIAITLFVCYKLAKKTPGGAYAIDWVKFNMPLIHSVMQQGATARFARSFSLLLQSGLPLLQALNLVSAAAGNLVISRALDSVAKEITEGGRLSEKIDKTHVFPDLLIQMCSIGEEAGSLPEMFDHVADYYEAEIDSTINAITAVMEPAMMIMVGLLVGVFIMGVLLPIMGISSAVQKNM